MKATDLELQKAEIARMALNETDENVIKKVFTFFRNAKEEGGKATTKSVWETAIAEGAVSPQEFHALLEKEIRTNW